jgi:hypothetical protein
MKGRNFGRGDVTPGPGPGNYAPDYAAVLPGTEKIVIRERVKERKKQPAVGYYGLPPEKGKGVSIGVKIQHGLIPGCFI